MHPNAVTIATVLHHDKEGVHLTLLPHIFFRQSKVEHVTFRVSG